MNERFILLVHLDLNCNLGVDGNGCCCGAC